MCHAFLPFLPNDLEVWVARLRDLAILEPFGYDIFFKKIKKAEEEEKRKEPKSLFFLSEVTIRVRFRCRHGFN